MTPRKTAAAPPKTAKTKPTAPDVPKDDDDVLHFQTAQTVPADAPDRVPLFDVDGVQYTMPAVVSAGQVLMQLRDEQKYGDAYAGMLLIERLCGPEAMAAILAADLTLAQWAHVANVATTHALGQLETSQKN